MIAAAVTAAANLTYAGSALAQESSEPAPDAAVPATDATAPAETSAPADAAAAPEVTAEAPAEPQTVDTVPVAQEGSAESAPPPAEAAAEKEDTGGLNEIIVTANRREESAQDVAISITVLDQQQLSNANITSASDLAAYAPSLSTNQRFGADNATFSIRGFTQELRTTASVASYMAEVVAPRGQSSQTSGDGAGPGTMFDLANVQVLKGPQGTLFGRNTTGGAVLLVPNKPSDEFEGYLELSGGERESRRAQGVINVPVSQGFKVRLGVDHNERDGHLENVTGIGTDDLASVDYTSVRLSTLWDVTDSVQNYTIFSYIDSDSSGFSSQLNACNPNYLDDPANFFLVFAGSLHVPQCQAQLADQAARGKDGFYDVVSTINSPQTTIKEKRLINTLTWDLTEEITLKNILAYAHLKTENGSDIFGTQFNYAVLGVPLDPLDPRREFKTGVSVPNPDWPVTSQETYVAELQLQGQSFEDALEWQGGVYWENSRPDGVSGNNSAGLISCEMASLEGDASDYNCYDILGGLVGGVLVQAYKTKYLNQAVYSQGTWHFNDQFSLTAGLRYTWDESKGDGIKTRYSYIANIQQAPQITNTTPVAKSDAATGLIEFDYKPFDGSMLYAKYNRGYRQGNVILAADPGLDTFDPEQVDTYELGLKTEFGGPIPGRFNLAVFYNDFTDQQLQLGYISRDSLQTTTIVNAGKSRIKGIEGEAFFRLHPQVTFALSFSLLDTKLLEQEDQTARVGAALPDDPLAAGSVTPIADEGDELPYAPKQTYVASLNWSVPVPESMGYVDLGATYSAIGEQRSAASSSGPFGMLDSFALLNLNATWTSIFNSPFDLVVFGTNVLDEKYVTYTSGTYNLLGFESRALGTPRFVGARLKYNFGAYAP
ncbi:MAG TPA: TonB-dependent receptor [Nevskiaceae bacterium]|nr:TonB-dependent receptor [Nevskiaceae bacterium]